MARRDDVLTAAIEVTAAQGIRGLTHRAVDVHGGLPPGTTSNCFRTRSLLTVSTFERLGELTADIVANVGAAPVRNVEELIQTLGFSLTMTLGPGRTIAGATAAMFIEAGIDEALHPTVVKTNTLWWAVIGKLMRDAGLTHDVENRARWLFSYGNGLVMDQMAMRDPGFDPVGAMRTAIEGFAAS
jgi:hypothetical protein